MKIRRARYIRVSSRNQNENYQLQFSGEADISPFNIFLDKNAEKISIQNSISH